MKTVVSLAAFAVLAGCTAAAPPPGGPPPGDPEGSCRPEPGQRFVGTRASAEAGSEMLAVTGAKILRWVPPRSAVTMDFNPSRLTVNYDDNLVITSVDCV